MHATSLASLQLAFAVGSLALAVACGGGADDGATGGSDGHTPRDPSKVTLDIEMTMIGSPDWEPVDHHQFSADMGVDSENLGPILAGVLPPPDHDFVGGLGIGPGEAHAGPYDSEIFAGMEAEGYVDQKTFAPADVTYPSQVLPMFMVVPTSGAEAGSSPDFASGPIIPNKLFPVAVDVSAFYEGDEVELYGHSFEIPALDDSLDPPFDVDGHSHFAVFDAFSLDGRPGAFTTRVEMLDANGEGWVILYHSTIE